MKTFFKLMISITLISLASPAFAGGWLIYHDSPYKGKVVDEETNQPIEGAAVVAVWYIQRYGGGAGPIAKLLDAKEAVTDKNGEFKIPSMISFHWWPFSTLDQPNLTVFKPGYRPYQEHNYSIRNRVVIQLPRAITREQRIKALTNAGLVDDIRRIKIYNFLKMMDKEYKELKIEK